MKLFLYIAAAFLIAQNPGLCDKKFPDDFLFGVATSAYQIEGAHNADGKGDSIWDHHLRLNPFLVSDRTNGNVACDSYNNYKRDLELLEDLGVNFYRFSISWSRLLPNGYSNKINPAALDYYNKLIDGLKSKNIEPVITLYHWDLPKKLQDLGGWTNSIVGDYFEEYARICFEKFGDRVKYWITFNVNWFGYGDDQWPPLVNQSGIGEYLYARGVVLAHAKVYHLYDQEFRAEQNGQVGITIDGKWLEAGSGEEEDIAAAERGMEFYIGLFANPIFGEGDFPKIVKDRVADLSKKENFLKSRLPVFSESEISYVKGAFDFLGINIYTAFLIKNGRVADDAEVSFTKDINARFFQSPEWPGSDADWLKVVPSSVRKVLNWIKTKYGNVPVIITENGVADGEPLNDSKRINYYKLYLAEVLNAIYEDGVNLRGYAAWSLLDNFEWIGGYSTKFGLYHVDFNDPTRPRRAKASAKWYKQLIRDRKIPREITADKLEL